MTIDELIKQLEEIKKREGNLPVKMSVKGQHRQLSEAIVWHYSDATVVLLS